MSNGIKPVAQTYYQISDVTHKPVKTSLDYSQKVFTYLKNAYTAKDMHPLSVKELEQQLNKYSNAKGGKNNDRCLLKGLYKDGFNGVNCIKPAPYLFFDIDVKNEKEKKENTHLFDKYTNEVIYKELQKIAVLVWRSNSGYGMAGILYVPQMVNYLEPQKEQHKKTGKAITAYVSEFLYKNTGIKKVKFDQAQSKFRQVRFLAEQKHLRQLNPQPFEFRYKIKQKTKEYTPGITAYKPKNGIKPYGDLIGQFDSDNDIYTIMAKYGFTEVSRSNGQIRVKHPNSDSTTTGVVNQTQNIYFNYSESLGGQTSFTPSRIVCKYEFYNDWTKFKAYLKDLGYREKHKTQSEIKTTSKSLKKELGEVKSDKQAGQIIFKYCYDLQTLSPERKKEFIKQNCPRPELEKFFYAYLNLNDYKIKFDKRLTIKKYVAEVLPDVLTYADKHNKIILRAETGKGKTTAFIRELHKHRPNARILILEPLTIIVNQTEKEYNNKAIFLTGNSPKEAHSEAQNKNMVIATYEQGIKQLDASKFDYVIIDEVHQLLNQNSFKSKVITELTPHFEQNKIIGLTGTPTPIFKRIGFKIIEADVTQPQKTKVEVRYLNNKPYSIALSHIREIKGKALFRLNDIKALKALKKQLIATNLYRSNEILLLYSDKKIKTSKDFITLANERHFLENIKLVLTTSVIDEGLSISQAGFTDIVFIESSYKPSPEPVKQFFARFRNEDPNRKNYLYLPKTKDQTPGRINPNWIYNDIYKGLTDQADETAIDEVKSTYNAIFSNDPYFYEDNTINPFYLAYSVNSVLFNSLNARQFLNFLETNYNLQFTENPQYNFEADKYSFESNYRKELKQQIARVWFYSKDEVLQALALHTQSPKLRKELTVKQGYLNPEIEAIVINNTKDFERLYKRAQKLKGLGIADPDKVLIELSATGKITLTSQKKYKDEVTLNTLNKMIFEPQNKADRKASERVTKFVEWCESKKSFTHKQMFKQLKKLGVYKNSDYTENMLFCVLDWFQLDVTKNTKTKLINVSRKKVSL